MNPSIFMFIGTADLAITSWLIRVFIRKREDEGARDVGSENSCRTFSTVASYLPGHLMFVQLVLKSNKLGVGSTSTSIYSDVTGSAESLESLVP